MAKIGEKINYVKFTASTTTIPERKWERSCDRFFKNAVDFAISNYLKSIIRNKIEAPYHAK